MLRCVVYQGARGCNHTEEVREGAHTQTRIARLGSIFCLFFLYHFWHAWREEFYAQSRPITDQATD